MSDESTFLKRRLLATRFRESDLVQLAHFKCLKTRRLKIILFLQYQGIKPEESRTSPAQSCAQAPNPNDAGTVVQELQK